MDTPIETGERKERNLGLPWQQIWIFMSGRHKTIENRKTQEEGGDISLEMLTSFNTLPPWSLRPLEGGIAWIGG